MPKTVNGMLGIELPPPPEERGDFIPPQEQFIDDEETLNQIVADDFDKIQDGKGGFVLSMEEDFLIKTPQTKKNKEEEEESCANGVSTMAAAYVAIHTDQTQREKISGQGERKEMIKIAVDAMGGDYAPEQQVKGALLALERNKDIAVILCGDEKALKAELAKTPHDGSRVEVVHTTEIITNEEAPTKAVKTKKDSSTVVAFRLLKEGKADGLVSSGSTGAVLSAGVLILGRLKGVSRPALCPLLPNLEGKYTFLCDCGANLECKPVNLLHFALLASSYAQAVYGVENPRCGLLNNGTEDHKGDLVHQEANALLKTAKGINYIGNIEGREIMLGGVDVVIADGYTGNIALKSVEGTAKAVSSIVKKQFMKNAFTKIRALFVKDILNGVKKSMDYEAGGGAMFLGLSKTVVKAHGNSKATSFSVAIEQAAGAVRSDMLGKTKEMLDKLNAELAEQTAEKTE